MGNIHIAAVNENEEPILQAVRELGAEKVILVGKNEDLVQRLSEILAPLGVDTETRSPQGPGLTGVVTLVQEIAREHEDRRDELLVNVGGAGRFQSCAFLSAAFVAGVRTVDLMDGALRFLPVLRFSYDEVIAEDQLEILQALASLEHREGTLGEIANASGLARSTISYQIRGGEKTDGLAPMGLVEVDSTGDGIRLRLTQMGATLAESMHL